MPEPVAEETHTFTVSVEDARARLDVYLAERLPDLTRSSVKGLVEKGLVLVDGVSAKAGHKIRAGENVSVKVPPPPDQTLRPEPIPLEILYEDRDIIVIDKQADLAVHPGAGRRAGTLVNALISYTDKLSNVGGPLRPGIVHRLDKDTTGSLVIARNNRAHLNLAEQFKEHTTDRKYLALVWGDVTKDAGEIDMALGRDSTHRKLISTRARKKRSAVTRYEVVERFGLLTLVALFPKTGRTHQLRVHLAAINHPVAGDPVYCKRKIPDALPKRAADMLRKIKRQLLHAETIAITHPGTNERMEFTAPMPEDMADLVKVLEEECS